MLTLVKELGYEAVQFVDEIPGKFEARHLVDKGAGLELLQIVDVVHRNGHTSAQNSQVGQVFFPEEYSSSFAFTTSNTPITAPRTSRGRAMMERVSKPG